VLETAHWQCFWKFVSKDCFPKLKDFVVNMHSMFGSTFSAMTKVKSKNRNRMAEEELDDSLRLAPLTLVLI